MPNRKRQHYVPKFYLRPWCIGDQKKTINLLAVRTEKVVSGAPLKTQASADYFYGKERGLEDALGNIENEVAPIIKSAIECGRLPNCKSPEYSALLTFVLLLHARTPAETERINQDINAMIHQVLRKDGHATSDLDRYRFGAKNPVNLTLESHLLGLPLAEDLQCKLLTNNTAVPFWTSDSSVVFYNQFGEYHKSSYIRTGIGSKGLQVFLPISPGRMLVLYDGQVYKAGCRKQLSLRTSDVRDVESLNLHQCIWAGSNIYFQSMRDKSKLLEIFGLAKKFRSANKPLSREYSVVGSPERTILRTGSRMVRTRLKLSFMILLKKAREYEPGTSVSHVRNELLSRAHQEVIAATAKKRWKSGDS